MVKKYVKKRKPRDPNKVLVGITHGRSGYQRGCGCDICREAETSYQANRRANGGISEEKPSKLASVTSLHVVNSSDTGDDSPPTPPAAEHDRKPGKVERLTAEECDALSIAQERPGTVAQALQLARIMDNPKQIGLWPTTSRQLQSILNDLRGNSKKKSKGRLAKVQNMTKGSGAVG